MIETEQYATFFIYSSSFNIHTEKFISRLRLVDYSLIVKITYFERSWIYHAL